MYIFLLYTKFHIHKDIARYTYIYTHTFIIIIFGKESGFFISFSKKVIYIKK